MKTINVHRIFLVCLFGLLALNVSAQTREARVVGTISLGETAYSFLAEENTSNVYKTSPHPNGELTTNQSVQITDTGNDNQVEVQTNTLSSVLYASLVVASGNGIYYPDMERMPTLQNGILYFDDKDHLNEAYDMVALYLDDDELTTDLTERLDEIEMNEYQGYTSFRAYFNTRFDWVDGAFDEDELFEIYSKDYIHDEIIKTFVNHNGLVVVEDSVYLYLAEHTIYAAPVSTENIETLEEVFVGHDLGKYDIFEDSVAALYPELDYLSDKYIFQNKAVVTGTNGVTYTTEIKTDRLECDQVTFAIQIWPKYTGYMNYNLLDDPNEVVTNATLTIEWGDGITQIFNNYSGEAIWHTYSASNIYHPQTSLSFNHLGGTVTINDGFGATNSTSYLGGVATGGNKIIFEGDAVCTDSPAELYDSKVSGEWKMVTKTWIKNNFLNTKIGGYTHAWKWVNNKWRRRRTNLSVQVHGEFRDNSCVIQEIKDGYKHQSSSKRVQKTKSKVFSKRQMGGIPSNWSKHNLQEGGVNMWIHKDIDPCQ